MPTIASTTEFYDPSADTHTTSTPAKTAVSETSDAAATIYAIRQELDTLQSHQL
jgi:hypothetical protein